MHLSIATHICGGEVADVKWSFTGEKATCGMEEDIQSECPTHKTVKSNCCHNEMATYTVDSNYNTSAFQFKEVAQATLHLFDIPVNLANNVTLANPYFKVNISPPGNYLPCSVTLSDICVFRI